ncbi:MAG: helix-turn-helix domain-containing protein [Aerococcus sp.]|nr:helix-turn-helix domain-containing protein [Aerococcus sp.]
MSNDFKAIRKEKGWSQGQMADYLGTEATNELVSLWERGIQDPSQDIRLKYMALKNHSRKNNIGDCLRDIRLNNNWTREEMANLMGVSVSSISKWENGTTTPQARTLYRYATVTGVDPAYLRRQAACQWEYKGHGIYITNCKNKSHGLTPDIWMYCPFCGRMIEW